MTKVYENTIVALFVCIVILCVLIHILVADVDAAVVFVVAFEISIDAAFSVSSARSSFIHTLAWFSFHRLCIFFISIPLELRGFKWLITYVSYVALNFQPQHIHTGTHTSFQLHFYSLEVVVKHFKSNNCICPVAPGAFCTHSHSYSHIDARVNKTESNFMSVFPFCSTNNTANGSKTTHTQMNRRKKKKSKTNII